MKVIVFGGAGLLGSALVRELRSHGHSVVTAGRSGCDLQVDFRYANSLGDFSPLVQGADVVVNAVGILIERGDECFDTVHVAAPRALFEACAAAHVARVVQISAIGAGERAGTTKPVVGRLMASKRAAETALMRAMALSRGDPVIVRPSLLIDPASGATQWIRRIAGLPLIALPGLLRPGSAMLAPILCDDAAAAICRICEHPKALHRAIELAGPQELSLREFLHEVRQALGLSAALWLPIPWALLRWAAKAAQWMPQKTISADGLRSLQAGITTERNEARCWLRCMPKPVIAGILPEQNATKFIVTTESAP